MNYYYAKRQLEYGAFGLVPISIVSFFLSGNQLVLPKADIEAYKDLKLISDNLSQFVSEHHCLYLYSEKAGNGKTLNAVRLVMDHYEQSMRRGYFLSVPAYLDLCKRAISSTEDMNKLRNIEDTMFRSDLVILDDIATKGYTDYENTILYNVINNCRGSIIFTGNVMPDDLFKVMDSRVADRIMNSVQIGFTGHSFRSDDFLKNIKGDK